ncbi:MAG: 4-(cytidine 5'-diphospho)-2-C-methyl-D-erythritol kinase [Alphaproteobacteria bacterium]|nr:4-(cytidine 5'-diphospho)-2-C-methyl-D-erythritol kinase [Alphaproteobacteria bacterium]
MTAERRALSIDAPAKVNLYLHVLGRRADGYHNLDSLVAFVDVADTLVVRPSDRLRLTITGPEGRGVDAGADNLVLRAARLLAEHAGRNTGADIRLVKRLPVAAGLGGGSADAAATLRLLDRLWTTRASDVDLARLGAKLGADVPVCLAGRATLVRGVGARLRPAAPLPPASVVLVNPRRPLATVRVFGAHDPRPRRPARPFGAIADVRDLARRLARRRNDLTGASSRLEPAVPVVLAELATAGALLARMSGSGATCFGLFGDEHEASAAAAWLSDRHEEWWIQATRFKISAPPIEGVT